MKAISRRQLLVAGSSLAVVAACSSNSSGSPAVGGKPVAATDPAIAAREKLRASTGKIVTATVTAAPTEATIAGKQVSTWAFGDTPSAGGIRVSAGDMLEATFVNKLPSHNTVHWHGLALRNDMDGVHDLTMASVEAGGQFTYRFTVPDPGTYWFHPHMGLELDRGLYAPLIVEDPHEPLSYDVEATLMLDDWLDGFGRTPDDVLADLKKSGGHAHNMGTMAGMGDMSGMSGMGGSSNTTAMAGMSGMDPYAGDVVYPHHLINGRAANDRFTVEAKPGQKVRLRIINAGSDTAYRFGVGGHQLTVTHADGYPVEHVTVDHLMIGMGERYDVLVTARDGAFPIIAAPEGKADPYAEAVLRTNTDSSPVAGSWPAELDGKGLTYAMLRTTKPLAARTPDRTETVTLTNGKHYVHGINGASFPNSQPIAVHQGERLRLVVMNHTMMFHPIHLHGHTFQLAGGGTTGASNARKDTVNVMPMSAVAFDIEADNPGQWMFHCHNTYHLEMGMATTFSYRV
jgi:FtsP/CotA-like multicopper oxidase with cupredoxin domain